MDSFLAIAIILLILSLITEKLTNWWRKYTPLRVISRPTGLLANVSKSSSHSDAYHKRLIEREVMALSILMGFLVAGSLKADLIAMITSSDPRKTLFWYSENPYPGMDPTGQWLATLLGIFLCGFFLSFGSKFFNDLVGMLYEVKGLKKKLNEEKTYSLQSMAEFEEYLKLNQKETAQKAISENKDALAGKPNVLSVHTGMTEQNGEPHYCAIVQLKDANRQGIPQSLYVASAGGKTIQVPVTVIENQEMPKAHGGTGTNIAEQDTPAFSGTLGCVLLDSLTGVRYALTCSHVALSGDSRNLMGNAPSPQRNLVELSAAGTLPVLGPVTSAIRNQTLDVALAGPVVPTVDNQFPGGTLNGYRAITDEDVLNQIPVKIRGAQTITEGQIVMRSQTPIAIQYDAGPSPQSFFGLFVVAKKTPQGWSAISKPGDSGAAILDQDNKVLGIVLAGNRNFTYVMPMESIIRQFDLQIA